MAKSRTKEIAREKTPQERVKDSYSYEKACNAAKNSGTPTYHFAVGDRVQVGHLPNCVVEEVMDDGARTVPMSSSPMSLSATRKDASWGARASVASNRTTP